MATLQQSMPHGVKGRPITVKTNSFVIKTLPTKTFYHYDVIMSVDFRRPEPDGQPRRRQVKIQRRYMDIINKMHDMYPAEFTPRPSYDGVKNMFSTVRHQNRMFNVRIGNTPQVGEFEVHIALVNEIPPNRFQRLIQPGSHIIDTTEPKRDRNDRNAVAPPVNPDVAAVMLLQVVVLQAPHIRHNFSLHSRSFYFASSSRQFYLTGGLEALSGIFQSVRPSLGRFLINVDTTTAAFYKSCDLLDLAVEHLGVNGPREIARACADRAKFAKLRTFLRNLKVVIGSKQEALGHGPKRVIEIKNIIPNVGYFTFDTPDGPKTIRDYWSQVHHTQLQYPDAFGISNGRESIFPAEKCYVLGGQRYSRPLPPDDMRKFLSIAVSQPEARIRAIEDAVNGQKLDYRNSGWMLEAGISVESRPLQIQGREIAPPQIQYSNNTQLSVQEGKWNVVGKKFYQGRPIRSLAVLNFDSSSAAEPPHVVNFLNKLFYNLKALGIEVPRDQYIYRSGNQQDPNKSLCEAGKAATQHLPPVNGQNVRPDMIVVILPAEAGPIRQEIKYYGDVVHGLATQCVRRGKYDSPRGLDQYCNNVALKINTKLGGINSIFQPPHRCLVHAMVVGCDISHPAPGVRNRPSIAGLVASIDAYYTKYSAHVRCQDPRTEVIQDLRGMLSDAIKCFKDRWNQNVPERIIIFRDGVSEGEYARVLQNEMQQVTDALYSLQPRPMKRPEIVFIVVGKRHHTRFFPMDRSSGDNKGNCRPGLVVDRDIVHSKFQSFYLLSHAGIIGTSRPSHYIVLHNEPNWDADILQTVSYALCHVYAPATRSVSIPAPVYYADKLCTHAAFQFKPVDQPGMGYDDSNSGVGSQDEVFSLEDWQARLKPAHGVLRERMYFI